MLKFLKERCNFEQQLNDMVIIFFLLGHSVIKSSCQTLIKRCIECFKLCLPSTGYVLGTAASLSVLKYAHLKCFMCKREYLQEKTSEVNTKESKFSASGNKQRNESKADWLTPRQVNLTGHWHCNFHFQGKSTLLSFNSPKTKTFGRHCQERELVFPVLLTGGMWRRKESCPLRD